MSKICAKCSKSVYPLEELKCLEKIWHKTCFRCSECGMILNMKNYKGFDKKPYCTAHYPHTKATVVANTPEMARIAQNTKLQSQVKYHEEFEKTIKGSKSIEVADGGVEMRRVQRHASLIGDVEYKTTNTTATAAARAVAARRQSVPHDTSESGGIVVESIHRPSHFKDHSFVPSSARSATKAEVMAATRRIGSIADYDPLNENYGSLTQGYHPASRGSSQSQEWEETITLEPNKPAQEPLGGTDNGRPVSSEVSEGAASSEVFDASEEKSAARAVAEVKQPEQNAVDAVECAEQNAAGVEAVDAKQTAAGCDAGGGASVSDAEAKEDAHEEAVVDNGVEQAVCTENNTQRAAEDSKGRGTEVLQSADGKQDGADTVDEAMKPQETSEETSNRNAGTSEGSDDMTADNVNQVVDNSQQKSQGSGGGGPVFQAVYEYEAQDDDEVSFTEGDKIVDVQVIDDGWVYGRVVRTGLMGMLPSNYIEPFIAASQ